MSNSQEIERRAFGGDLEVRAIADTNKNTLRGYALKFDVEYDMGWMIEVVQRGALDTADMKDVRILFNHDPNQILGRTRSQTARVGVDDIGLWYEVDLPNSPVGENVRESVLRGDITQSSWGFSVRKNKDGVIDGDKWKKQGDKWHRTLIAIDTVYDASPVTFPANPDTTVAKRTADSLSDAEKSLVDSINTKLDMDLRLCELALTL